jgi:hypothetical protein
VLYLGEAFPIWKSAIHGDSDDVLNCPNELENRPFVGCEKVCAHGIF